MRGAMLALRSAMDEIETGVLLLDADLPARFINKAFRKMWALPDAKAEAKPSYAALIHHGRDIGAYEIETSKMDAYVAERRTSRGVGSPARIWLMRTDGTVMRVQCAVLLCRTVACSACTWRSPPMAGGWRITATSPI